MVCNAFRIGSGAGVFGASKGRGTRHPDEAARKRLQQVALTHNANVGHYFGCRTRDLYALVESPRDATSPIRVRRVHASYFSLVVSGHTAAAGAALRAMSWLGERVELCQPIDARKS
jgi:hypothetical protein